MEFKSAICTSVEQSKRLIELGLKKETADMCWQKTTLNGKLITYPAQDAWHCSTAITNYHFPAWSLHRLIELLDQNISIDDFAIEQAYDTVIEYIAFDIRHNQFNHEYLEERK